MPGPDTTNLEQTNKTIAEKISETVTDYSLAAKQSLSNAGTYVSQSLQGPKESVEGTDRAIKNDLADMTQDSKWNVPEVENSADEKAARIHASFQEMGYAHPDKYDQHGNIIQSNPKTIKDSTVEAFEKGYHWVGEQGQQIKQWVQDDGQVKTEPTIPSDKSANIDNKIKGTFKEQKDLASEMGNETYNRAQETTEKLSNTITQPSDSTITGQMQRGMNTVTEKFNEGVHWISEKGHEAQHYVQEVKPFGKSDRSLKDDTKKSLDSTQNWAQEKGNELQQEFQETKQTIQEKLSDQHGDTKSDKIQETSDNLVGQSKQGADHASAEYLNQLRKSEEDKLLDLQYALNQKFTFSDKVQQVADRSQANSLHQPNWAEKEGSDLKHRALEKKTRNDGSFK